MKYYDLELIDIGETVENFKFTKVSEEDLNNVKRTFITQSDYFDFKCAEGHVLLNTKYFRGLMYSDFSEPVKTTQQENKEDAVEISKIKQKGE